MPETQPTTAPSQTTPNPPPSSPPTEMPSESWMGGTDTDFADMDAGRPMRERDDSGKFKPAVEKPSAEKPAEKPSDKPAAKPIPPKEEDESTVGKPAETTTEKPADIKPVKAADLRAAYEGLKKRVKEEWEPQVQSLKAKVAELESRKPDESGPIVEKLKAAEARNAELEKQIEYVDFTQSKEFTTKYADPYKEAWTDAVAEFRELTVREQAGTDPATDEPIIKTRPADENDLLKLANMRLSDMDAAATEMFGPSASRAINHIQNLKKLSNAQHKALEEAKKKAGEWKSQRTIDEQTRAQNMAKTWTETNQTLEAKWPKAFKADDTDTDDKLAHTRGFAMADLMFMPSRLTPEQIETLPPAFRDTLKAGKELSEAQRVQLTAIARLKMANHDRKVVALKKAVERIAELEKTLKDYERSEPPAGKAGAGSSASDKPWDEQVADELKALDK